MKRRWWTLGTIFGVCLVSGFPLRTWAQDPPPEEPPIEEPIEEPVQDEPPYEEPIEEPQAEPIEDPAPVPEPARPNRTIQRPNRETPRERPNRPTRSESRRANRPPPGRAQPAVPAAAEPASPSNPNNPRVAFDIEIEERPMGRVVIELWPDRAPNTVANFLSYVDAGFYNDTTFHRIIEDFLIQGGGYTTAGQAKTAGLLAPIKNEAPAVVKHDRGTIAAARLQRDRDSATSQFFLNIDDNRRLERQYYCVFGQVVEGMELVDRLGETPTEPSDLERRFNTRPMVPPVLKRAYRAPNASEAAGGAAPRVGETPANTEAPVGVGDEATTTPPETTPETAAPATPATEPETTEATRPRVNRRPIPPRPDVAPPRPDAEPENGPRVRGAEGDRGDRDKVPAEPSRRPAGSRSPG